MSDSPSGENMMKASIVQHVLRNYNRILAEIAPGVDGNVTDISVIDDVILMRHGAEDVAFSFVTEFRAKDYNIAVNGTIDEAGNVHINRVSSYTSPAC